MRLRPCYDYLRNATSWLLIASIMIPGATQAGISRKSSIAQFSLQHAVDVDISARNSSERGRLAQLMREAGPPVRIRKDVVTHSRDVVPSLAALASEISEARMHTHLRRSDATPFRAPMMNPKDLPVSLPAAMIAKVAEPWVLTTLGPSARERSNGVQIITLRSTRNRDSARKSAAVMKSAVSATVPFTGINRYWRYEEGAIPGVGHWFVNTGGEQNLIVQANDMDVPNKGIDLAFRRTYNSLSQHDYNGTDGSQISNYGDGWTNTFDAHIAYNGTSTTLGPVKSQFCCKFRFVDRVIS